MIRTVVKYIMIIMMSAAAACSGHSVEVADRPSSEPDISPELSDPSSRIAGSPLTLRYDDGGILFSCSDRGVIGAVRLSDGVSFEYDPTAVSLTINGVALDLYEACLLQRRDNVEWHRLTLDDRKTTIFIVTDI